MVRQHQTNLYLLVLLFIQLIICISSYLGKINSKPNIKCVKLIISLTFLRFRGNYLPYIPTSETKDFVVVKSEQFCYTP
jgi:hypothetical protein